MRIVHIADTHFGKVLKKVNFTELDQPYWLQRFLEQLDALVPDVLVAAGDIFDTRLPSLDAIKLWNSFLSDLHKRNITVFVVPGNHDQAARLSADKELVDKLNIHIAGPLQAGLEHFELPTASDSEEKITFWLMPYISPGAVGQALGREDIIGYDMAARELLKAQKIDFDRLNVLVAHQNVMAGSTKRLLNDNERSIGFSGEIDYTAFDGFDYVALGHIHARQHIGREQVCYAGAPLQYDFSEEGRWKGFIVIDIKGKDSIEVKSVELKPLHQLVVLPAAPQRAATLEELLELGRNLSDKEQKYIKVRIWNTSITGDTQGQLEHIFGEKLLEIEPVRKNESNARISEGNRLQVSMEESFTNFFKDSGNGEMSSLQSEIMATILEQQVEEGYLERGSAKAEELERLSEANRRLISNLQKLVEE